MLIKEIEIYLAKLNDKVNPDIGEKLKSRRNMQLL